MSVGAHRARNAVHDGEDHRGQEKQPNDQAHGRAVNGPIRSSRIAKKPQAMSHPDLAATAPQKRSAFAPTSLLVGNFVIGTSVLAPTGMLNELSAGFGVS